MEAVAPPEGPHELTAPGVGVAVALPSVVDERAARRALRAQIARLEDELSAIFTSTYPRLPVPPPLPSAAGPRVLGLGELERARDALAGRVAAARDAAAEQSGRQTEARALLAAMLADPPAYKWLRVSNADLGEPGCKHYHVRPRLGPLGMLAGWWRVKISSGCPLPRPRRPRAGRVRAARTAPPALRGA